MTYRDWLPSLWNESQEEFDRPLVSLKKHVDSVFEDFNRGFLTRPGNFAVRSNVSETDKDVTITAELPGVEQKDVDVSVTGNQITIKGEKKSETEEKKDEEGRQFHRVERTSGTFQRTTTLPFDIDTNAVQAEFNNGVLTVTIPKPAELIEKTKKIEIKQAA